MKAWINYFLVIEVRTLTQSLSDFSFESQAECKCKEEAEVAWVFLVRLMSVAISCVEVTLRTTGCRRRERRFVCMLKFRSASDLESWPVPVKSCLRSMVGLLLEEVDDSHVQIV